MKGRDLSKMEVIVNVTLDSSEEARKHFEQSCKGLITRREIEAFMERKKKGEIKDEPENKYDFSSIPMTINYIKK